MKIHHKLFLIVFGFSLVLVTSLVLLMQWSIGKGMVAYVNTKEIELLTPVVSQLAQEYKTHGSWQFLREDPQQFHRLLFTFTKRNFAKGSGFDLALAHEKPTHHEPKHQKPEHHHPPPFAKPGPPRPRPPRLMGQYVLVDQDNQLIAGFQRQHSQYSRSEINIDNQLVGYLLIAKRNQLTQGYELDFIEQQQDYLLLIALAALFLVAIFTLPLARHLVQPVKKIAQGMHQLTQGNYQHQIQLKRQDELADLIRDYNELALTLSENDSARKRWLANISHELRTPVAILRGELEAMLDKVRPLNLENIQSANHEVKHLQQLIDDLNLLTSADIGGMRYRKQKENLVILINDELSKYQQYLADAGITLKTEIAETRIEVYADKVRLCQLWDNIINNCIKYSQASELHIGLSIEETDGLAQVSMAFIDNGVGVARQHLDKLFDHLYRVEDSRNRTTGGSGLGLTICRHIVDAHQGEILARRSKLGGLEIVIKLPIV